MRSLVVALLLLPAVAQAEEGLPPIPPGDDVITVLREGDPAPYTGQLFDQNTAIRWGLWLQQYRSIVKLEKERASKICAIEVGYHKELLTIEMDRSVEVTDDLKERLKRSEEGRLKAEFELANPAWYRSGTFHFALGVATAGAVIWLGARVVD